MLFQEDPTASSSSSILPRLTKEQSSISCSSSDSCSSDEGSGSASHHYANNLWPISTSSASHEDANDEHWTFEDDQGNKNNNKNNNECLKTSEMSCQPKERQPISAVSGFLILVIAILLQQYCSWGSEPADCDAFVPGAGFSGFWFTLGRLRSVQDPASQTYYCYSAGCLAVVATLQNYTMEQMHALAVEKQTKWNHGLIDRYDVVESFIDDLVYGHGDDHENQPSSTGSNSSTTIKAMAMDDPFLLSKLHVITSAWDDGSGSSGSGSSWWPFSLSLGGLRHVVRTPRNAEELHELLSQTTWIPYATGRGLWHRNKHIDGGFTALQHPRCKYNVGLALDFDLLLNIVNPGLSKSKVERLWNLGLAYGL